MVINPILFTIIVLKFLAFGTGTVTKLYEYLVFSWRTGGQELLLLHVMTVEQKFWAPVP